MTFCVYFLTKQTLPVTALAMFLLGLSLAGCQESYDAVPTPTITRLHRNYDSNYHYDSHYRPTGLTDQKQGGNWPAGWVPPASLENRNRWKGIMIHHSADDFGDAISYDLAHRVKGWDCLGYDFVINNGNNDHGMSDGAIQVGIRWKQQREGAHCRVDPLDNNYWNEHTIGICLVGNFEHHSPTEKQWQALVRLIHFLQQRYHIPTSRIIGHRDVKATKCPGKYFSFYELRRRLGDQTRIASKKQHTNRN